jgi:hypothetical protein
MAGRPNPSLACPPTGANSCQLSPLLLRPLAKRHLLLQALPAAAACDLDLLLQALQPGSWVFQLLLELVPRGCLLGVLLAPAAQGTATHEQGQLDGVC